MLAKKNRLNLAKSSARTIFRKAKKKFSKHFIFFYRKSKSQFKAAVVIPKKKKKMAADRNELKRKVYQIIRQADLFDEKIDLVVLLRKSEQLGFNQLKKEIKPTLDEIKHF